MQVSGSNPFYSASPMFNSATNPVTVTGTAANGNVEGVTANGVKVFADPNGMMAGFSLADVLTSADKAATGYDPSSGKINTLAIAIANYRANGSLQGEASSSLIDALKKSLATTGSYPATADMLMSGGKRPSSSLAYETFNALLSAQEHRS